MVKIPEWIDEELQKRGWTRAELARRADVSQSTISMVYSGQRNMGPDLAERIAQAFNMPRETVFRVAGLLPPASVTDASKEELNHLFDQLPPEDQQEILDLIRFKAQRGQQNTNKTSRSKRPARSAPVSN